MDRLYFDKEYWLDCITKFDYYNMLYKKEGANNLLTSDGKNFPYHKRLNENIVKYVNYDDLSEQKII